MQYSPSAPYGGSNDDGWTSGLLNWSKDTLGLGRRSRDDNLKLFLGFPAFAGFSVAVGAAVIRRRKKNK